MECLSCAANMALAFCQYRSGRPCVGKLSGCDRPHCSRQLACPGGQPLRLRQRFEVRPFRSAQPFPAPHCCPADWPRRLRAVPDFDQISISCGCLGESLSSSLDLLQKLHTLAAALQDSFLPPQDIIRTTSIVAVLALVLCIFLLLRMTLLRRQKGILQGSSECVKLLEEIERAGTKGSPRGSRRK